MRNKAPLPLMEQLVVILVFALTATLCLQGFVLASRLSRQQEAKQQAVVQVQNAAELIKHTAGDYAFAFEEMGGQWDGQIWTIDFDQNWKITDQGRYRLCVTPMETDTPLLGCARIQALDSDAILFELTAMWQEVNRHEIP